MGSSIPYIEYNLTQDMVLCVLLLLAAVGASHPYIDDSWHLFDDRAAATNASVHRSEDGSSCVKVFEVPMRWAQAQTACANAGHTSGRRVHMLSSRQIGRDTDGSFDASKSALFNFTMMLAGSRPVWVGAHRGSAGTSLWIWEVSISVPYRPKPMNLFFLGFGWV